MTSGRRILFNALATYGRTLLQMGLGLFSSRWILQSLGVTDYGLMGVVGTLIVLITFLNTVFNGACSRFFAFSIGKDDIQDLVRWFNTALSVHIALAIILVVIGWPLGEWAIDNVLNIPPDRLETAHWVFRFSLVSAFWTIAATPYMAMYIATQNIVELTIWEVLTILTNFGFVYCLTTYQGDSWLIYAGFTVGINIFFGVCKLLRARYLFAGCKINLTYWGDRKRIKEMFSFSGWTLFGNIGYLARVNIPAILLNQFFNPLKFAFVNASYQVGIMLANYTQSMSSALLGAFSPQITTLAGANEHDKMVATAFNASKYGTLLILIFAIPISLEVDHLLKLWLKNPPLLASAFCRLVILQTILDNITYGHMAGIIANGKIKWYQITTGLICLMSVPASWAVLSFGAGPLAISWVIAACMACCSIARLLFGKRLLDIKIGLWVKAILIPITSICVISTATGFLVMTVIDTPSFFRIILTAFVTFITTIASAWFFMLNEPERVNVSTRIASMFKRLYSPVSR